MELKLDAPRHKGQMPRRSNRTFMELKLREGYDARIKKGFQSYLHGIEIESGRFGGAP